MLTALFVSVPLNLIFANGYTGNRWGDGIINYFLKKEWPPYICAVMGQLSLEFVDKVLTIAAVYFVVLARRFQRDNKEERKIQQGRNNGNTDRKQKTYEK